MTLSKLLVTLSKSLVTLKSISPQSPIQPVRLVASSGEWLKTTAFYERPDPVAGVTREFYVLGGAEKQCMLDPYATRDRICSAPCERLIRSAVCVVDARLRRGKKATELVVIPGHQLGVFVPEMSENRGIQAGDAVGFCLLLEFLSNECRKLGQEHD